MPFTIVRNDITKMTVDAIVNTANPKPVVGAGVDAMIHTAAGSALLDARRQIGDIDAGGSAITPAFDLQAKFVIHTVGPVWRGGDHGEEKLLRSCYDSALALAVQKDCQSVAFPLISTGNYGFPKDRALQIAIAAFSEFLLAQEMQIYLVVFDQVSFRLSEKLFQGVASYIDEHYAQAIERAVPEAPRRRRLRIWREECLSGGAAREDAAIPVPCESKALSLEEMLRQEDAGFTQTLLSLIDKSGQKDSQVYKKANISKQHFSKIRNNPNYKPTKPTALALALALELSLEETKDLIGRAGYALTNSSKFDLIIRYFIEQGNYNVVQINMALYEFDQVLLGN